MKKELTARLVSLFILGFLLFNFPIIDLSGSLPDDNGFPGLFFTIFLIWFLFILMTGLLTDQGFFKKKRP
jgi:hypothetical protein